LTSVIDSLPFPVKLSNFAIVKLYTASNVGSNSVLKLVVYFMRSPLGSKFHKQSEHVSRPCIIDKFPGFLLILFLRVWIGRIRDPETQFNKFKCFNFL
jgi:hypothetical protein